MSDGVRIITIPRAKPMIQKGDRFIFLSKRSDFMDYCNRYCVHRSLDGRTPAINAPADEHKVIDLNNYRWQSHCRGLYETPIAAQ